MTQARPKRLLLGALALVAPLPLPFSGVVGWEFAAAYWAAVLLFLFRAWRDEERWLPVWAMNLLALAYVPFFYLDLTSLWQGRLLRPVAQLVMFALAVKLLSLRSERDKWQVLLTTFFLFLASMGSSVHPSIVLYLGLYLVLSLVILARFAGWDTAATVSASRADELRVPLSGFVTVTLLFSMLAAIPLFAFLPRLRQPYVLGGNAGGGLGGSTVGANSFGLDSIGRVRTSRAVALRLAYEQAPPAGDEMRLRTAAYDGFTGNGWRRGEAQGRPSSFRRSPDGFFRLSDERSRSWALIWLRRVGSARLVLPVDTVAIDVQTRFLSRTPAGEVAILAPAGGTLGYRVGMAPGSAGVAELPPPAGEEPPELVLDHIGTEVIELAARVAGDGAPRERADRLVAHLLQNYEYTLNLGSRPSDRPIERFLLETRRGHCEYFASALVLLLRAEGIPARLATGYLGAEYNPLEEYFIVRQSNAHAWVEAYIADEGWRTMDPTPPAGRPGGSTSGWLQKLGQAYDYMLFRWDRYVLTYGFGDQIGILLRLRERWGSFWERRRERQEETGDGALEDPASAGDEMAAAPVEPALRAEELRWASLAVLLIALLWALRHRRGFTATRAYRALRERASGRNLGVTEATPPLELQRRIALRHPSAAPAARRVIDLYLRESFSGAALGSDELAEARDALQAAGRGLRKTA